MLELEAEWLGSGADAVTMIMIQWRWVVMVLRWCRTAEAYRLHDDDEDDDGGLYFNGDVL